MSFLRTILLVALFSAGIISITLSGINIVGQIMAMAADPA